LAHGGPRQFIVAPINSRPPVADDITGAIFGYSFRAFAAAKCMYRFYFYLISLTAQADAANETDRHSQLSRWDNFMLVVTRCSLTRRYRQHASYRA